jgi:hypothetical protein
VIIHTNIPLKIQSLKDSAANRHCCCMNGDDIFIALKPAEEGIRTETRNTAQELHYCLLKIFWCCEV